LLPYRRTGINKGTKLSRDPFYPGRLGLQQRVLPAYRAAFFDLLAQSCQGGLSVFAGQPQGDEQIAVTDKLEFAHFFGARNRQLFKVNSPFFLCWQAGILDWLESWDPDALIVEANPRYPTTCRAVGWMHTRGRPVLGWGLGAPAIGGILGIWRKRSRLEFLGLLDGVIAYSRRGAAEYQKAGVPPDRVFVAPNAAASCPTKPPPKRKPEFEKQPVVLFVGRLQNRKRIDHLLHACSNLPIDLRPKLVIVGEGPSREDLQELASRIYPQAEFAGARFGVELERYFQEADLFVLPGTGGLAVQQAMSFGLPVIVAQGDGTQDDLVRPVNGWIVRTDDLESLETALRDALAEPARLRLMGSQSYRIVSQEINLERMTEAFVQALNSIDMIS
jgi:glycosyltransferase involved in cell wall biosynthesis